MGNYNRDNRSGNRRDSGGGDYRRSGNRDGGRRREMHDAVCDKCGVDCKVPFMPTSGKPVYCSACFEKTSDRGGSSSRDNRGGGSRDNRGGGSRRPNYENRGSTRPQNNEQLDTIIRKLDKILDVLSMHTQEQVAVQAPVAEKEESVKPKEKKETKKKAATKKKATKKKTPVKKKKAK